MTESQLIGLGGGIGLGARHVIGRLFGEMLSFPGGALVTNAIGPSLVVVGLHWGLRRSLAAEPRVALTTGALAGFMLLATVNRETVELINDGRRSTSVLIILMAALGCLLAGGLGFAIARAMV